MIVADVDAAEAHAARLDDRLDTERARLAAITDLYRGRHRVTYRPPTATAHFDALARAAVTNVTPLVVATLVQRLYVDGIRTGDGRPSPAWQWWQANGLDARQDEVYEAAAVHGYAYVLTLPGGAAPSIRPQPATCWAVEWSPVDDGVADVAFGRRGDADSAVLLDDAAVWRLVVERTADRRQRWAVAGRDEHPAGEVPLVRFTARDSLVDAEPVGDVEPLRPVQERLNQTVFDLLVAQTYSSAPQRYIIGIDGDDDATVAGLVRRVWTLPAAADDTGLAGVSVGQLPEAGLTNLVGAIGNALRVYGLVSQTPPHYLLGEMVNMSAEAMTAANVTLSGKVAARQGTHGEAWERVARLAARVAGDAAAADDVAAEVVWRDTEPRSIAQVVDALGKLTTMLGVPPRELWPRIPGVSAQEVASWRAAADAADVLAGLDDLDAAQAPTDGDPALAAVG